MQCRVVRDDQQNRDSAQRIQLRNFLSHFSRQTTPQSIRVSEFLPLRLVDRYPRSKTGAWFQSSGQIATARSSETKLGRDPLLHRPTIAAATSPTPARTAQAACPRDIPPTRRPS